MRLRSLARTLQVLLFLSPVVGISFLFPAIVAGNEQQIQALLEKAVSKNRGGNGGGLLTVSLFDRARNQHCAVPAFVAGRRAGPDSPLVEKDTPYGIASITKTFIATLALSYAERGLLDLDVPVVELFEDDGWVFQSIRNDKFTRNLESVTARQLLSHRSGLPDYWDDDEFLNTWEKNREKYWGHLEVLRWAGKMNPRCKVDKCFNYSDTNYLIMGMVLEEKFGKKLHQLLREEIFDPLGMGCSWMYFEEEKPMGCESVAHSYEKRLDVTRNRMQSADWASGGIYSTLDDQSTFFGELFFAQRLLSQPSQREMWDWRRSNWSHSTEYGLGIYRVRLDKDMTLIGHEGFHNAFAFLWEEFDIVFTGSLNQESNNAVHELLYPVMRSLKKEGLSHWLGQAWEACAAR
jgi:D-alanyl-D-alanine carboxypeptidase